MLEYFAYKKYKKNKVEKAAKQAKEEASEGGSGTSPQDTVVIAPGVESPSDRVSVETPVLDDDDARFLELLTASSAADDGDEDDEGLRPPLPPRVRTPDLSWDSDTESFVLPGKGKDKEDKAVGKPAKNSATKSANRFSLFLRRDKDKDKQKQKESDKKATKDGLDPNHLSVADPEVDREKDDLTRVLDDLNLSARNNRAFSLSADSTELVQKFTLVLKDLVNGVPTAVNDLTSLLDDKDGKLAKNFEKLPKSMKKLVTQLPEKLTTTLAPELLAVAAEAQGLSSQDAQAQGGLKGAAKRLLWPKSLADIVTKPTAIVSMLKGIMNALKLRWPAFIGTNLIWSVAIFCMFSVQKPFVLSPVLE